MLSLCFIQYSEYAKYTITFWAVFKIGIFRQIVGMSENAGSIREFDEKWVQMKLQFTKQVQTVDELTQRNKSLAQMVQNLEKDRNTYQSLYVNQARISIIWFESTYYF